jgi:hypothetical protein
LTALPLVTALTALCSDGSDAKDRRKRTSDRHHDRQKRHGKQKSRGGKQKETQRDRAQAAVRPGAARADLRRQMPDRGQQPRRPGRPRVVRLFARLPHMPDL